MANAYIPFMERYQAAVVQKDGCWEWKGTHTGEGYSTIRRNGKHVYAHRVAYELEDERVRGMVTYPWPDRSCFACMDRRWQKGVA